MTANRLSVLAFCPKNCISLVRVWLSDADLCPVGLVLRAVQRQRAGRLRVTRPHHPDVAGGGRVGGGSHRRRRGRVPRSYQQQQEDGRRAGRQVRRAQADHAAGGASQDQDHQQQQQPLSHADHRHIATPTAAFSHAHTNVTSLDVL